MMSVFADLDSMPDVTWPKEIAFGLVSTESEPDVERRWTSILAQLEQDVGVRLRAMSSADACGTIEALRFGKAQAGCLPPTAYVEASKGNYANVAPLAEVQCGNGLVGYRSCLIVHADSDVFRLEDTVGKTFTFSDETSMPGYLAPLTLVTTERGVDLHTHFSKLVASGSHEASVLAVTKRTFDVASTSLPGLERLVLDEKVPRHAFRVIWVSELLPGDAVVVRKDVPTVLRRAMQTSLTSMRTRYPELFGYAGDAVGGFLEIDDARYQRVRELRDSVRHVTANRRRRVAVAS